MNASSRPSTASATKMALATNAAGPSRRRLLKTEPIAQSEIRVGSALAALLIGGISIDVLPRRQGKAQSATEGLRGKASDLIEACEILCSGCKKDVRGKLLFFSPHDRESQACNFRGAPLCSEVRESALRFRYPHGERPLTRQVNESDASEGQNPDAAIPIPMLAISEFESARESRLAGLPTLIQLEEGFVFREHSTVVSGGASHGQRSPLGKLAADASHKFSGVRRAPLEEISQKRGAPMWTPLHLQTEPFVVFRIQEIEGVIFLAEAQFVLGFAEDGPPCDPRLFVCRFQAYRLLKFQPRSLPISGGSQRTATGHAHIGPPGIECHSNIERAQGIF